MTDAPNVPPPIHRSHATKVVVHLEVRELEGCGLDPDNGKDYIIDYGLWNELHIKNPAGSRRIDFDTRLPWSRNARQTDKRDR